MDDGSIHWELLNSYKILQTAIPPPSFLLKYTKKKTQKSLKKEVQAPGSPNLSKDFLCPAKQVESSEVQPGDLAYTCQIQDLAKNLKWTNVTAATKADNLWSISSMFKAAQAAPLRNNPKPVKSK